VNEQLTHADLYAALFFETSSDTECDADLAVKQLEQIAWSLRQLSPEDQELFRDFARRMAATHRSADEANQIQRLVQALLPPDE
jgi:hypothetical protein